MENKNVEDNTLFCSICDGKGWHDTYLLGKKGQSPCDFCDGSGKPNKLAISYLRYHKCQCYNYDRKNCYVCGKKCHHTSSQIPKILVRP